MSRTNTGTRLISLIMTALMVLGVLSYFPALKTAAAEEITSGDYTYTVLADGTAEITSYTGTETEITIPSEIDGYAVTSIGSYSFQKKTMTSVVIPEGVTSIGEYAFCDCSNLTSIIIPVSVTKIKDRAFYGCVNLTSINIPTSVTTIGIAAFSTCKSLTSIIIPESVTSIGASAFLCEKLTSIDVDDKNLNYCDIDGVLFNKDVTEIICFPIGKTDTSYAIPESVTSIANVAFYYCEKLTSITIPEGVTTIGVNAFYNCSNLTSINIPESVTAIGGYAFKKCVNLTSITIPASVNSIGGTAFENCDNVTIYGYTGSYAETYATENDIPFVSLGDVVPVDHTITIVNSDGVEYISTTITPQQRNILQLYAVDSLGHTDFTWNETADEITIDENGLLTVTGIPTEQKQYIIYVGCADDPKITDNAVIIIKRIEDVTPPVENSENGFTFVASEDGTIEITGYSENKTEIIIPEVLDGKAVTKIGDYAFENNTDLTLVKFPKTVTAIGEGAFKGCVNLEQIIFNSGVETIGNSAFEGCTSLFQIIPSAGLVSIGENAFKDCPILLLFYVPANVTSIAPNTFDGCNYITIAGFNGTYAETYATENEIRFETIQGESNISGDFIYDLYADGTICIIGYVGTDAKVTVPAEIDGHTVKKIETGAFVLAFDTEEVTIPETITEIAPLAFEGCINLTSIIVDDNNTTFSDIDGVLYTKNQTEILSYPAGRTAETYEFPAGVTVIGNRAFSGSQLSSVEIPSTVTQLKDSAFRDSKNLGSIVIPDNVTELGESTFEGCTSLTSARLSAGCTDTGWSTFEGCTSLTDVTIPDSVTEIMNASFYGCTALKSVIIPEGVTAINKHAFTDCTNLRSIKIPASVTDIYRDSFDGCEKLIIHGEAGSLASTYADEHEIKFMPLDENGNISYVVNMPLILLGNPNVAGKPGGEALNTPDGTYLSGGEPVADNFDGENYYLNGKIVDRSTFSYDTFSDNAVSSTDLAVLIDVWVNPQNKANYKVFEEGNFFNLRAKYCDENEFSLKGSGDLNAEDVIAFTKFFINYSKDTPLKVINVTELEMLYDKYSSQVTENSSEDFKAYVAVLEILKTELCNSEQSAALRKKAAEAALTAFANQGNDVNYLLTSNPDKL